MSDAVDARKKYQLLAELGHGGMADVYLAVLRGMKDFKKLAVVKRLRSHLAEDPEFLAMFLQEARIAARLNHPNVVHTFEVGHDGRHHFMAMEYLQGHPYSALLARAGRSNLELTYQLRVLVDSLEGLEYAHELKDFDGTPLGLVHRDVSPQNIFVTYDGQVKLLDFGIAKALDSAVETRTGVIKGKLAYMSPEQALANPIDRRADVYSVGVMLWEAIAQRRRWKGMSNVQMMKEIVAQREPELPPLADLPASLGEVLKKALAHDPDQRYPSARAFQADLEGILDEMGARASNRELGKMVAELFELDRQRLQEIIESELKKIEEREGDTVRPGGVSSGNLVRLDLPPVSGTPSFTLESPRSSDAPSATEQSAAITMGAAPPERRKRSFALLGVALAGAALAVGYVVMQNRPDPAAQVAPAPETVQVRLTAQPGSAVLFVNNERKGVGAFVGELSKSLGAVTVRAESPGYQPVSRIVNVDRDVELKLELEPVEKPDDAEEEPQAALEDEKDEKKPKATWGGRRWVAPKPKAEEKEEAKPPPSAPPAPTEPVMKAPPKSRPNVVLDTDNPWKK